MKKQPVYKTKFSFLIYLLIFTFFFSFALYLDYDENRALFTMWIYYLIPIFAMTFYFIFSLLTYTKMNVYESGFELSSHYFRKSLYFKWSEINQIEFRFNRFIELVIFQQEAGKIKKRNIAFTHISKRQAIRILYILFINGIDVVALGHINKDWKNNAQNVAKPYQNRLISS